MKVEYRYSKEDKEFLSGMKKERGLIENLFSRTNRSSYYVQKVWMKIHACQKELIRLYCEQSNIENKEDSKWGICINGMINIPEKLFDCSVGMVRKMRNNVKNSDGTCKTCPYFMSEDDIDEWYGNKINKQS